MSVAKVFPLTQDRFKDLDALFSQKGCSFARGCWCMAYRISGQIKTAAGKPPTNLKAYRKRRLKDLAGRAPSPGLIAYDEADTPVGWVAVGPRAAFPRLQNSPIMKPVNNPDAWAIVCFVVPTPYRGKGIAKTLIRHAVAHAEEHGAPSVEAFPFDRDAKMQSQWLWHGALAMFEEAGFKEIARRKPDRPVVAFFCKSFEEQPGGF